MNYISGSCRSKISLTHFRIWWSLKGIPWDHIVGPSFRSPLFIVLSKPDSAALSHWRVSDLSVNHACIIDNIFLSGKAIFFFLISCSFFYSTSQWICCGAIYLSPLGLAIFLILWNFLKKRKLNHFLNPSSHGRLLSCYNFENIATWYFYFLILAICLIIFDGICLRLLNMFARKAF